MHEIDDSDEPSARRICCTCVGEVKRMLPLKSAGPAKKLNARIAAKPRGAGPLKSGCHSTLYTVSRRILP